MSLRCNTRSGVEPGLRTGIVTSRTTKALRSITVAYPTASAAVPAATAAEVFREGAPMKAAYCQSSTRGRLKRDRHRPVTAAAEEPAPAVVAAGAVRPPAAAVAEAG